MLLMAGARWVTYFGCFCCSVVCRCPGDGPGGLCRLLGGKWGGRRGRAPQPSSASWSRDACSARYGVGQRKLTRPRYFHIHIGPLAKQLSSRRAAAEIGLLVCSAAHGTSRAILAVRRAAVGPPWRRRSPWMRCSRRLAAWRPVRSNSRRRTERQRRMAALRGAPP